jgi:hypothetical protein
MESLKELVLAAVGTQFAQDGRGFDFACFDR